MTRALSLSMLWVSRHLRVSSSQLLQMSPTSYGLVILPPYPYLVSRQKRPSKVVLLLPMSTTELPAVKVEGMEVRSVNDALAAKMVAKVEVQMPAAMQVAMATSVAGVMRTETPAPMAIQATALE
jgi:hypothetical protein